MNKLLALPEFFSSAAGVAVLAVIAVVLAVFLLDLNYRFFAKYLLDFIFGFVITVICSPVLAVTAIVVKVREGAVLQSTACIGAKGKIIYVRTFCGKCGCLKKLPLLLDVLGGKLSIVGPKLMPAGDAPLIADEAMERFNTRPGLVSPVAVGGCKTYEEMFAVDVRYAKKREMFRDFGVLLCAVLRLLRGEYAQFLGECAQKTYAEALIGRGAITQEDAEKALSYVKEAERNSYKH